MTGEKIVMAIDPGSSKCGLALVRRSEEGKIELLWRSIEDAQKTSEIVRKKREETPFSLIVVGSGTKSRTLVDDLRQKMPSIGILIVDEKDTTMQARERYWVHNPRKGLWKLIPSTLRKPPVPVDDFVALILAERVLAT